ncbi:hypothetical protein COT48_01290 [Candidatus Woesearchaeota archaeon CG08_land_8_20_14_0_20_47_9]|nr:MAG: hypothetical protein AUJ69_04405 [Candidatus Woesearchaeota archaeon CG1_02_47_18]PIO04267.1 MAG: hypothetical protein COT48_01290 [Candidatus Woesearchaeota archaeon CG08_land_8_20_14_0_20_47_9]
MLHARPQPQVFFTKKTAFSRVRPKHILIYEGQQGASEGWPGLFRFSLMELKICQEASLKDQKGIKKKPLQSLKRLKGACFLL